MVERSLVTTNEKFKGFSTSLSYLHNGEILSIKFENKIKEPPWE